MSLPSPLLPDLPETDAALMLAPEPPVAERKPHRLSIHGDTRVDEYYWLRNREDPAVIRYLEAENAYTAAMMRHTERLQEQLYCEMVGRIQETDLSVPERIDDWFYYSRTEAGRQLQELRDGPHGSERADEWQENLVCSRAEARGALIQRRVS